MKWKYEADKNLIKRTKFDWTIVRPVSIPSFDIKFDIELALFGTV